MHDWKSLRLRKKVELGAGNAAQVRGFHISCPAEPHDERRSRSGSVHERAGRNSSWEAGAVDPTGVAQRAPERAGPTSSHMHPPRIRTCP